MHVLNSGFHLATSEHGVCLLAIIGLVMTLGLLWSRTQEHELTRQREKKLREELQAYARLDESLGPGEDTKPLAKRVCRTVADASSFRRVAVLVRDAEGKLTVSASSGLDDLTIESLNSWGAGVVREDRGLGQNGPVSARSRAKIGDGSFEIVLGNDETNEEAHFPRNSRRAIVTMLRAQSGSAVGALVVCADGMQPWPFNVQDSLQALVSLALKLARTIENAALVERLMRAEKLAGLGQLASGVAHELNNPLTAVLGFSELIAETTNDPRIREDAQTITQESLRMRRTVQNLQHFWRPVAKLEAPVNFSTMLGETADQCVDKLRGRGVSLVMQMGDPLPELPGDRHRLQQVVEHLVNNAAQAIAAAQDRRSAEGRSREPGLPRGVDEGDLNPTIRITVSHDEKMLRMIVSDTGPGFREPARVFDPFYTTSQPGEGSGLGLSICYGIVREHGGEISAYNLHPHGAAVVVELPLRRVVTERSEMGILIQG